MTKVYAIPAMCGACDHAHALGPCPVCAAAGQPCPGWTAHAEHVAANDARELRELADFGGPTLLGIYESNAVMEALARLEEATYLHPERSGPILATIQLGESVRRLGATETLLRVSRVMLGDDFWKPKPNPIEVLTDVAREWFRCADDPDAPPVAWMLVCSGDAGDPQQPGIPAHLGLAADIDGRIYTVVRYVDTGRVERCIEVARRWAQLLGGDMDVLGDDPGPLLAEDGLNDGHMATMHLMLVTRVEVENRAGHHRRKKGAP
jgi:hypothetical protein